MKTKLRHFLIALTVILFCIFSANAQQQSGVNKHQTGITYNIDALVSKGGVIYRADVQTTETPPHADWDVTDTSDHTLLTNIGTKTHAQVEDVLGYATVTSIKTGGHLTANTDTTLFDIEDGKGCIVDKYSDPDNPTITLVTWSGLTGLTPTFIGSGSLSFVAINVSGTVIQQVTDFTAAQRRDLIVLGDLIHTNNVNITATTDDSNDSTSSNVFNDFLKIFGNLNVYGNNLNEASTDLTVRKEAGESFLPNSNKQNDLKNPNYLTSGVLNPLTFLYIYDDGSGGITVIPSQTLLDPDQWDNKSGTLQSVPNNQWTNQWFYYFPASSVVLIRYGEELFSTITGAENAEFDIPSTIGTGLNPDLIRTVISIKEGATDASSAEVIFVATAQRGLSGGGGTGGAGGIVQDLQDTYNNSITPEIITDGTRGALTIQGGTGNDADNIFEGKNNAGTNVWEVTGLGNVTANSFSSPTLSGSNTGDNSINTLYSGLTTNANHTGDATGSTALTLATVNSNVGSFTNADVTVNAKGLVTAVSNGTGGGSGIGGSITDNQIAVGATTADDIEGSSSFTWDGSTVGIDGDIEITEPIYLGTTKSDVGATYDNRMISIFGSGTSAGIRLNNSDAGTASDRENEISADTGNKLIIDAIVEYRVLVGGSTNPGLKIDNARRVTLGHYGDGNKTSGTVTYGAAWDSDGNFIEVDKTGFEKLSSAPGSPAAGDTYYDTTTNKHRGYNGSTWNDFY